MHFFKLLKKTPFEHRSTRITEMDTIKVIAFSGNERCNLSKKQGDAYKIQLFSRLKPY